MYPFHAAHPAARRVIEMDRVNVVARFFRAERLAFDFHVFHAALGDRRADAAGVVERATALAIQDDEPCGLLFRRRFEIHRAAFGEDLETGD